MATVYSLICWGGRLGKSVTVNASTDLVTLTNHGLRNGKGVAFVSGTLPTVSGTALALNTTYYAKWISTSTFELYYDSALTSKIDFTSTGASLVMKSAYLLGLSDLSRWGEAGSERIYDGLTAWNTGRASASPFDAEVAELGEGYDDIISNAGLTINVPAAETTIISTVNGQRTSAFHGGALDSGFVVRRLEASGGGDTLLMDKLRSYVDGFSIRLLGSNYNPNGLRLARVLSSASRMIVMGRGGTQNGSGIVISAATSVAKHCLAVGWNTGIAVSYGQEAIGLYNNIAAKNGTGITSSGTSGVYGYYYNNISIGNTTNWGAVSGFTGASNNAGISGNSPWVSSGGTTVTVATTDFANWGSSTWATTDDYSPASISSPQVNSGTSYFGMLASDLSLYDVPAYNNGGAEYVDVGCYEFDLGYGNHPSSDVRGLAFTGLVSGSKVKVFETGTDTEKFSTASSGTSETWSESVSGSLTVDYVILKAGYLPIRVTGITVTAGPSGVITVPVNQVVARWYQAASGLTLNTNIFANASTKKFGLTIASTGQNLASYLFDQWLALGDSGEAYANKPFPIEANGPNSFTWLDGWEADLITYPNTISSLSRDGMRYLNTSGVMTASWCAMLSAGVPSGLQVRYQQAEGAAPSNAVATGNIDQLIQIYGDSSHGNFDYRGYMVAKVQAEGYDQAVVDVVSQYGTLEDQLYVIALIPSANGVAADNPAVSSVTITDHGASPVTWNAKSFSLTITDSSTTSGEDIIQWIRHALTVGGTFQGKNGFNWHDLVQTNGDKFKGVRGAIYGDTGAALKGVRVLRGTDPHPDFTLHTADDGSTVSTIPPAQATASILANSRIQLYNVTTSAELDNSFQAGTSYANTLVSGVSVGDTLRLRVCKIGYDEAESFAVWTTSGCQFLVNQSLNDVYAAWGIDGSTVTEFSGDVIGHIYVDSNDLDGATTKTRLGAWYSWVLTTEIGIRHFYKAITYVAANAIRVNVDVANILIENVNATTALRFTDTDVRLYRSDGTSIIAPTSYSIHNDYSGVPDVVETGVSGLTTAESNQLMALPDAGSIWGYSVRTLTSGGAGGSTADDVWSHAKALTVPKFLALK